MLEEQKMKIVFKHLFLMVFTFLYMFNYSTYAEGKDLDTRNYSFLKHQGDFYCNNENFTKAIIFYNQINKIKKNETDLNKLGLIYYMNNDYNNALKCFEEASALNQKNERTKKKIEYMKNLILKASRNDAIMMKEPKEKAPLRLHNLVEVKGKLKNKSDEQKLHKVLDFIWSDEEGKCLLQTVINNRTPIYLCRKTEHSNVDASNINLANINLVGYKKIPSSYANLIAVNCINIKESDISILVVAHELCHTIKAINYPNSKNSQEEEMCAYIFGYNLAERILTGRPMDEKRINEMSVWLYNTTFKNQNCSYRNLQLKDDFGTKMSNLGFKLPYYDNYCNVENLNFKETKKNMELQKYLKKINTELSTNYDTVYTNKLIYSRHNIYVNKKGEFIMLSKSNSKFSRNITRENTFNIKIALLNEPYPEKYIDDLIPLCFYRYNKKINVKFKN